jgi:hypothetical protein
MEQPYLFNHMTVTAIDADGRKARTGTKRNASSDLAGVHNLPHLLNQRDRIELDKQTLDANPRHV